MNVSEDPRNFDYPCAENEPVPEEDLFEGDQFTGWTSPVAMPKPKMPEPKEVLFLNSLISSSSCTIGSGESKGRFLNLASLAPTREDKLYCLMRACTSDAECAEHALQFRSEAKTYDLSAIADDYLHQGWLLTAARLQPECSLTDESASPAKKIQLATLNTTCTPEKLREARLCKWNKPMPLRVYFRKKSGKYSTKLIEAFTAACKRWQAVSDGRISFRIVDTALDRDIEVEWHEATKRQGPHFTCGETWFGGNDKQELSSSTIYLYKGSIEAVGGDLENVCLHELGHALGILVHSDDPKDIMYPDIQSKTSIAGYSRCLIRWLYPNADKNVPTIARK